MTASHTTTPPPGDSKNEAVSQKNYYHETKKCTGELSIKHITDRDKQTTLDGYIKKYGRLRNGWSRETGYTTLPIELKKDDTLSTNPSLVKRHKRKVDAVEDTTTEVISKLDKAPRFPPSCIDTTEHVVALQDEVEDFTSPSLPAAKKQVVYSIPVSRKDKKNAPDSEKEALFNILNENKEEKDSDTKLTINFDKKTDTFIIEAKTQDVDILEIMARLTANGYTVENCHFEDIRKNQGICFVDRQTQSTGGGAIHAVVNIADSEKSGKLFLDRDAGAMSGGFSGYTDSQWTFNLFKSMPDLRAKAGFVDEQRYRAIKIRKVTSPEISENSDYNKNQRVSR